MDILSRLASHQHLVCFILRHRALLHTKSLGFVHYSKYRLKLARGVIIKGNTDLVSDSISTVMGPSFRGLLLFSVIHKSQLFCDEMVFLEWS